jgi:flagellar biosynthetic protein FlhB
MADEAQDNKTEPATSFRRSEARKKGKVAKSTDVGRSAVFVAAVLILWATGSSIIGEFETLYRGTLSSLHRTDLNTASASMLLINVCLSMVMPLAPALVGIAAVAALAGFAQAGFMITTEQLIPKPEKLNPASGMGKLFSLRSIVTLGTSFLKIFVVLAIAYLTVRSYLPTVFTLYQMELHAIASTIGRMALDLALRTGLVLLIVAAIDYAYQKWQYERDLRMSKQEVKDEQKVTQGNPEVQSRIRHVQITMARRRMLGNVKKADVVIRNPTHYAVALKYDPKEHAAPIVLAKGADHLAKRIIEIAKKHKIHMVHEPPLAQALYKSAEIGKMIPPKLYRAVAKILVHVMRIKKRRGI